MFRAFRMVPDRIIPGTLNAGHTLPTVTQAFFYIAVIPVDVVTLISMMTVSGTTVAGTPTQELVVNTTMGVYGQQQFGWNDRLFLTAGVNWDASSAFGADDVSPDGKWAVHTRSSFTTPPVVGLVRLSDGASVRTLADNAGLRDAAVRAGVRVFEQTPATALQDDGRTVTVVTPACTCWMVRFTPAAVFVPSATRRSSAKSMIEYLKHGSSSSQPQPAQPRSRHTS